MRFLAYALLILGVIAFLYGQIRFLVVAYNRNLWWFFGCLFVPPVAWLFFFLNLKATIRPFAISIGGLIMAGLGAWMSGLVRPP